MSDNFLEAQLRPFLNDIKSSLENKNYHAALALALTLPDICSNINRPKKKGRINYINWVNDYFLSINNYDGLMTAKDLYALRCAFLHNGFNDVDNQAAKDVVNKFRFIYSDSDNILHRIKISNSVKNKEYVVLGLSINLFCTEITESVLYFIQKNRNEPILNQQELVLLNFENGSNGFQLFF